MCRQWSSFSCCSVMQLPCLLCLSAREFYEIEGAGHNDCWQKGGVPFVLKFRDFITQHTQRAKRS